MVSQCKSRRTVHIGDPHAQRRRSRGPRRPQNATTNDDRLQNRWTEVGAYDSLVPDTPLMHEVLGTCEVGQREGCCGVVEARHPEAKKTGQEGTS